MHAMVVDALIGMETFVVLFVALHDWVPLGTLNDVKAVHAADPPGKLMAVTALSTLPFAFGLGETLVHAGAHLPTWLLAYLWVTYGAAVYGVMRAWWLPYLFFEDPARAQRYQAMFSRTHALLPLRHGIRPDTLHMVLHVVIMTIIALLAFLTWAG